MQINKPYMNRIMYCIGHALLLIVFCLLLSCSKDEEICSELDDDGQVTLCLNVSSFGLRGDGFTRSVAGNPDEDRIKDIWVFQYDAETGVSLKTPVYLDDIDSNYVNVQLTENEGGTESLVCIVANTNEAGWALDDNGNTNPEFDTYDKLKEQSLPRKVTDVFLSGNLGERGKAIPMFGVSKAMPIVSKCYVSIPLVRMFARVHVSMDPSYIEESGMKIEKIKFDNIPFYSRIKTIATDDGDNSTPATYPSDISWRSYDAGTVNEVTLYVPENLQGKVLGMTSKQMALDEQFPTNALKVQIEIGPKDSTEDDTEDENNGTNNDNSDDIKTYTIYPGLDMINDFNIKRNYIYNVTVSIKKDMQ